MDTVIAVTGEGPTDYGHMVYDKKRGMQWEWGPVFNLLERCMKDYGMEDRPNFQPVQKEALKRVKLLRSERGLSGLAIPARKFRNYCCEEAIDRGIFYADADAREGSAKTMAEARNYYREIYEEACSGLGELEAGPEKTFIPMIPLKMIENWLLADEAAFESVFGKAPKLPPKPELIWGDKHDPSSDYPKHVLKRALEEASEDTDQGSREVFVWLAEAVDVTALRNKCGISFETFYQDFKDMLQ